MDSTLTPHLDKLMSQAELPPVWGENAADERLKELFATHGPALVAMLKQLLSSVNDNQLLEAEARAERLLTQLDQEATCQK